MRTHAEKKESVYDLHNAGSGSNSKNYFVDNRAKSAVQRKQMDALNNSGASKTPVQKVANNTGLPDQLKSGIENISGHSMDDVKVHYNSAKPAQLNAHAYAQGTDIHIATGQEKHLPHEAWHVVQQKQGRVKPTMQMKGKVNVNDDKGLEKEADIMGRVAQLNSTKSIEKNDAPGLNIDVIQREPWDAAAHVNEGNLGTHLNLPANPGTHNTQIGAVQDPLVPAQTTPGERHLDTRLLGLLQTVFDNLPVSHIKGNASLGRVVLRDSMGANGQGMASFYSPANHSLNLVVPGDVNSWFYLQFDKWPFGDLATTLVSEMTHFSEQLNKYRNRNISTFDFFKEVIAFPGHLLTHNVTSSGTTLGKLNQGLSTETFVQWMIRHETGHSVDHAIGWYQNRHYREPACGGWQLPVELNMVQEILNTVGINGGVLVNLNAAYAPHTAGVGYNSMINAVTNRTKQNLTPAYRAAALATFETTNPGGTRLVDFAEDAIRVGLSRPWESGGAKNVGGRAYQRDTQHDDWVSYIHAKYALRNSNYQFQNPGEWFAESYQAFFKGGVATLGSNLNDPMARAWFLLNLVPPPAGGGALINMLGDLQHIAGAGPAIVAPGAGTAVVPTGLQNFLTTTSNIAVNAVKIPFDIAMGAALLPVKLAKKVPPVNWALKWLGY